MNKAQTGIPNGSTTINTLVVDQEATPVKVTLESRGEYDKRNRVISTPNRNEVELIKANRAYRTRHILRWFEKHL